MPSDRYAAGWVAYREYCGENTVLVDCLSHAMLRLPLRHGYSLVDAGSGDGTLVCELVTGGGLPERPGLVHFVEPIPSQCPTIRDLATTYLAPARIPFSVHPVPLADFDPAPHVDIPGLLLLVHASYYLSSAELEKLAHFRAMGWGIVVLENDPACWVNRVFRSIGNTAHPQFDEHRYERLLAYLGCQPSQVERVERAVRLRQPDPGELTGMQDFFAEGWVGRKPAASQLADRLGRAIRMQAQPSARFVYRIVCSPPCGSR